MKERILIVEDQFIEANNLQLILERAGYQVSGIARSVPIALGMLEKETPDFVLLDIYLKGPATGIDLAKILRERKIPFIYLSANSNKATLDAAKATYPYGFLVKPFREKDVLVTLEIARYLHGNNLASMLQEEEKTAPTLNPYSQAIIGQNEKLQKILRHLQIVAPTDTSVLLLGESGTGKERLADLLHDLSGRQEQPFIKVNCAALPATLIESVLFGHEKGAFTGAYETKVGKFEQADGGTLFLDEIGEVEPAMQTKLLRVLQEKEIERIGSNKTRKINVRIIAATNLNLEKEVAEGRFRMDLYYRLNVFPLQLPPLRERLDDIPLLVHHFLQTYSKKIGKPMMELSEKALESCYNYHWPGNIRELEHTIERAILLNDGPIIPELPIHTPATPTMPTAGNAAMGIVKTIEENEREHIMAVLKLTNGKIFGKGGAAELLGMNVSTLNARIKKLGIEKVK
ncbi:DNA-binding NtrC family response regulator [Chitinophaga skermanii]|uniref:DNA-binding NtrC family response regulator n=1 Tax=Chitinophaga skermanii TaxID=331697 RepID=A0A327Q7D2_9BACT|nr:sigma-54 dependent transcriptional regulator [Chitinophaga skermanii]RAI99707.1 DNA-binding NtrC family response regulator [Chitinophaga skermanii]